MHHWNPHVLQMQRRPNPRQHQQLWRAESTTRHNHFFARVNFMVHAIDLVFDTDGSLALKHDLRCVCMRYDMQIILMSMRV